MQRLDKTKPHQAGEGEVAVFGALCFPLHGNSVYFLLELTIYMHLAAYPGVSLVQNSERAEICSHRKV